MALSDLEKKRIGRGMKLDSIFSTVTGKVEYNEGTERINQSLEIILGTNHGEVAMLPTVGSGIAQLLFEPADDILRDKLDIYVRDAIEKLEPRMSLQDVVIDIVDHHIYITVNYILTGSNIEGKFDYEITKQSKGDIF
jgi:phage baseplate assembly protein W